MSINRGDKIGYLTVMNLGPWKGRSRNIYCLCKCGKNTAVLSTSWYRKRIKSCGCYNKESSKARLMTHGYSYTSTYRSWAGTKDRCYNKNNPRFKDYGKRGIQVCNEWRRSFSVFLRDMKPKPYKAYSLDRIDNDGNYEATNCRWATPQQQANNRKISNVN